MDKHELNESIQNMRDALAHYAQYQGSDSFAATHVQIMISAAIAESLAILASCVDTNGRDPGFFRVDSGMI